MPDLPIPPDAGSFDVSSSLGLTIPGVSSVVNKNTISLVSENLSPDLARKIQNPVKENFNKNFPYYLAIAMANDKGVVTSQSVDQATLKKIGLNAGLCIFNINPSQITVSNQFAINVSATNKGVLEENNGVIFRSIQISGSTGFLPQKPSRNKGASKGLKIAQALVPAASSAVVGLLNQVSKPAKAALGGQDNDLSTINAHLNLLDTGYFQFWQLNNFMIAYAQAKVMAGLDVASKLRLIFGSGKDNIGYVVTPITFDMRRDVSNPLLYRYQISLKAWDTVSAIPLQEQVDADIPSPDSPAIVAALSDVLTQGRKTIQAASNILSGVTSDLNRVVNVYNQGLLAIQDSVGLANDIRTFSDSFTSNTQALLVNSKRNQSAILKAINDPSVRNTNAPAFPDSSVAVVAKSTSLSSANAATLASAGFDTSAPVSKITPGGEDKTDPEKKEVPAGAESLATQALGTDQFLDQSIDDIDIPQVVQDSIDAFREQSQNLTAGDVLTLSSNLQSISDNYALSVGLMDPVYAATYGVPVQSSGVISHAVTEDDIITAVAIQESKQSFISTLATGQFFKERDPDPFLLANDHLPDTDQLKTPNSSIAVPFQRGSTIDTLAQQYLGDAKRSREIIVLNNLRAPYIDEVGFNELIFSANGRIFVVLDTSRLTIGQMITLSSNSAASTRRQILDIEDIGGGEFRITVDGLPNLAMYVPGASPKLFARLPGTVGPGDTILIPSGALPDDFAAIRPTPLFNRLSHAEQVFKVDIALDTVHAKDIAVTPSGDADRSFGYKNAIQALRLAVEVERGELDRHPSYGLPTPVGSRNSDVNLLQAQSLIRASITNDPRFLGADVTLSIVGSTVKVKILAQGTAGTGQIPVTFDVGKV